MKRGLKIGLIVGAILAAFNQGAVWYAHKGADVPYQFNPVSALTILIFATGVCTLIGAIRR